MSTKLGLDAKVYRNTGSYGAPIWSEMPNVRDLTLNLTKGEADVSRRGSGGWDAMRGARKSASIDFDLLHRDGIDDTADRDVLRDSFLSGDPIDLAIMDGDIDTAGTEGLRAVMEVFSFTRNETQTEAITYTVNVKPTDSDNPPEWLVVE